MISKDDHQTKYELVLEAVLETTWSSISLYVLMSFPLNVVFKTHNSCSIKSINSEHGNEY
jgi:hypothetical protein